MKRLTVIRALVAIEIISMITSVLFFCLMPWPQSLHDFLEAPDVQGYVSDAVLSWLLIPFGLVFFTSGIGLWLDWSPAKYIYLGGTILAIPFILLSGPDAILPTEQIFAAISSMANGALLFVLFIMPRLKSET